MKTATLPSIRVAPEVRAHLESVLNSGESLSGFVETAVHQALRQRSQQAEFLARGLSSLATAREKGNQVDAQEVLSKLERRLTQAKTKKTNTSDTRQSQTKRPERNA